MQRLLPVPVVALLLFSVVAAQDGADPARAAEVEPVQLIVRRAPSIEGVDVFGEPGVELQVAVRLPGKPILTVDAGRSRLVRFVDDQGTDLAAGAPKGFFSWVSMSTSFREEPVETALFDIKTATLPVKKAGRMQLEATVAVISASGSQQKQQQVALKKGAKIEVGPIPMTIASVEDSQFGDGSLDISIQSDQRMDAVRAITFLGADGQPIEAREQGSSSFGFGNRVTYARSYGLPVKLDEVTVRIDAYAKMETIDVPIKLSVGVGL